MEKIILKNGTEIEADGILYIGRFLKIVSSIDEVQTLKDSLTDENLEYVEIKNDEGLLIGTYSVLSLIDKWEIEWHDDGIYVYFGFIENQLIPGISA